jgi:hypothetical protein
MKALSGYAEWFWLMAKNWKDIENRSWHLPATFQLPQRIYLHASKTKPSYDELNFIDTILISDITKFEEFHQVDWNKYRGMIIGEITIIRQIRKNTENPKSTIGYGGIYSIGDQQAELEYLKREAPEYFSPWFFGEFGFVVKSGVLYDKPIPYKGRLGFFEISIPSN